ncbi:MAG TPA: hypothetical protein VFF52_13395 [Isosphaeraceae bacterium]|nr:hypothetical protein [Isosphaeraceae bacterium]
MRTSTKRRRRTQPRGESLEEKTLLSTGSGMPQVAPHVTAAPLVTRAAAAFSGTLTGPYSNVSAPGFASIRSYAASGTLSGVGSARLRGTLFIRPGARAGRLVGQLDVRNTGGSMILNVSRSAAPGSYTYRVVVAHGSDTAFKGGSGTLGITQAQTLSVPFYTSGQSTMTFS